jgi:hypothetical protein
MFESHRDKINGSVFIGVSLLDPFLFEFTFSCSVSLLLTCCCLDENLILCFSD